MLPVILMKLLSSKTRERALSSRFPDPKQNLHSQTASTEPSSSVKLYYAHMKSNQSSFHTADIKNIKARL